MAMDKTRLKTAIASLPVPVPVPVEVSHVPKMQEVPQKAQKIAPEVTPFTGLDPLTKSLIESVPIVPAQSISTQTSSPTQPTPQERVLGLKKPTVLVALGGTLAAGLLLLMGAKLGHPAKAIGQGATAVTTPTPKAFVPHTMPVSQSWLIAGSS